MALDRSTSSWSRRRDTMMDDRDDDRDEGAQQPQRKPPGKREASPINCNKKRLETMVLILV
jgi:hypothetical protein